jgi:hypothetical protein
MKKLTRLPLPTRIEAYLRRKAQAVSAQPAAVERIWKQARQTQTIQQLVMWLKGMNQGRETCMYCEHNEATTVDHFQPRSRHPQGAFEWDNLNYACQPCNQQKGAAFSALLLNPTAASYCFETHFELDHLTGMFDLLSMEAQATEPVYKLNRVFLKGIRKRRFLECQNTIIRYAECRRQGDPRGSALQADSLREFSPATIFETIKLWYQDNRKALLEPGCVIALQEFSEILGF